MWIINFLNPVQKLKTVRVGKRIIKFDEPPKRPKIVTWAIEHWKILLPVFATIVCAFIAAGVSLFIHFDNKSKGEASQKQGTSPQQVRTEGSQKLIIHTQPTSNRKTKQGHIPTNISKIDSQEPASRIYARQQVERWRKEIQSFASRGGSFNKQEFMQSSTYTEMHPFLSSKTIRLLREDGLILETSGNQVNIDPHMLATLYKELDKIAAK